MTLLIGEDGLVLGEDGIAGLFVVANISANATASSTPGLSYVYNCTGAITLTLPTAVGNTNVYYVKNVGTATVSIATTSSQTIDGGAAPISLIVSGVSLTIISNGTNWDIY